VSGGPTLSRGDDLLVHQSAAPVSVAGDGAPEWFDRFYFAAVLPAGSLVALGGGVYPNAGVIDGYAALLRDGEQRNVRFSDRLGPDRLRAGVGPLRWQVTEPLQRWRLELVENPQGFALDAEWAGAFPPWLERIGVDGDSPTDFGHFFQFGRWRGTLTVDGRSIELDGAVGVRDRSWGIRRTRDRLGMHLWVLANFGDTAVALHYNEHRDGSPQHCDGVVLRESRPPERVRAVAHDLVVDAEGEFERGEVTVTTAGGDTLALGCEGDAPGLYMAGGGYGGWHGIDRGPDHLEHERWRMDGDPSPRTLPLGLVDKPCSFTLAGREGSGIFELALSRSSSYSYRPGGGGSP
jgi:hypothetical protein